jgi:flagellum-specific ATP synthase
MRDVTTEEHMDCRSKIVDAMATYADAEDMISIGAYVDGADAKIDAAKRVMPRINEFLRQKITEKSPHESGLDRMKAISGALDTASGKQ